MAQIVDDLLADGEATYCGPIETEIRRGLRSKNEQDQILTLFEGCHYLSDPSDLWKEAGQIGALLGKSGKNVKTLDLLIANYALSYDIALLSRDQDFKLIQKCGIPLRLHEP